MGAVPERLPLWPTVLTQAASSFVNRVSPANVGGMALNARYLQKCGIEPARALLHGTAGQSRWVLLPEQLARLLTLLLPGRLDAYRPGGPGEANAPGADLGAGVAAWTPNGQGGRTVTLPLPAVPVRSMRG